ncbi:MAG TPA: MFS transporter [Trebonia sp.]|nr:MFS transporter [Trebonia sp.]
MNYRSKFRDGTLSILARRDFRRFYMGYSASLLGTAMSSVAIAFAVLGDGGTPTGLGVVFAANIVPMIAFTLGGGAIADRLGRRPVMLGADVARCAAQGVLAVALYVWHPRLWLFVAAALVVGTGNAFFQPALSGLPVQLAPRDRLGDVNALIAVAQPAAQVAGPALAGILIAATSPATVVAVDAASYAVGALALARLRFPGPGQPRSRSLLRDLADGWAEFSARSWIWVPTVQFALFNLLTWGPYLVLGPVLALDYLGGAGAWGAIMACYGGGAILGGLLALGRRPRRPRRPLAVANLATLGFALPPLALALHLPAVAVAAGALLAGLGSALGGALEATVEQRLVPPQVLSRVGAFNMVGAFAFGPVAFAAAGPVAAAVGARAVLGFGAAWAVLGTLVVQAVPAIRSVTWQDAGPADLAQAARRNLPPSPAQPREIVHPLPADRPRCQRQIAHTATGKLLLPPPGPVEHLPVPLVPVPVDVDLLARPGLVDGVGVEHRRARRRLQQPGLGEVQVAPDVADGDHRHLVRFDETQLVVLERLDESGGGLMIEAELALDLPVGPAATAHPDHDALEDVLFFHRQDVLQDAELLAIPGQHRNPERGSLVRNLELVVVHSASRYRRRAHAPTETQDTLSEAVIVRCRRLRTARPLQWSSGIRRIAGTAPPAPYRPGPRCS